MAEPNLIQGPFKMTQSSSITVFQVFSHLSTLLNLLRVYPSSYTRLHGKHDCPNGNQFGCLQRSRPAPYGGLYSCGSCYRRGACCIRQHCGCILPNATMLPRAVYEADP